MAVTIENIYTPSENSSEGVTYGYIQTSNSNQVEFGFAPDQSSIMGFGGAELRFSDDHLPYELEECEYTDTSLNVFRTYNEYNEDTGRYTLFHTVNGGTPVTYASSNEPIKFSFYTSNGKVTWHTGTPSYWQATITMKILYIANDGTTHFTTKNGGTVIVGSRQTVQVPQKTYSVTEVVT